MHIKLLTCILIIFAETIYSGLTKAKPFYSYDRFNNRAVSSMFVDTGNIYYTSKNFHSEEFAQINNFINKTCSLGLRKINTTKSLPNL
jgi:hypothetical protein